MKIGVCIYHILLLLVLVSSCSVTKFIPDGAYLLDEVKIVSDNKTIKPSDVSSYIRQNPNNKWFSSVKVPLYIYSLSGIDSTRWSNKFIRKIGDAPVIYNEEFAERSKTDIMRALQNFGYMGAQVKIDKQIKKKKLKLIYRLYTGPEYKIQNIIYDIRDPRIEKLINSSYTSRLYRGMPFNVNLLNTERQRISDFLQSKGFYKFNKDFITYTADTTLNTRLVDITMHLHPYKTPNKTGLIHPQYTIHSVNILTDFDISKAQQGNRLFEYDSIHYDGLNIFYRNHIFIRPSVLANSVSIAPGELYNEGKSQNTQKAFGRLRAIKYSDIRFIERENTPTDSAQLDCFILLAQNKQKSISIELEGTNSSGDLGAAASVSFQNKNLFKGSELFTFKVRGAYEAVTGLQGYTNENYTEYGVEASINFPRFLFPFLSHDFKKKIRATSEIDVQFNSQIRPEFSRRVASVSWSYKWSSKQKTQHKVDVLDINYVYMPWISPTFKKNYLDSINNQNSILKYNYENLLIMKMGYGFSYHSTGGTTHTTSNNSYSIRFNIETAGNLLYGMSHLFNNNRDENNQYTIADIAYAQYIKGDIDFAKSFRIDSRNSIVFHSSFGIAYPYGNSSILPFEKRYFSGGANSVRGWSVRRLGPGKFAGNDKNIDFINQSGDIKLDVNLEYRTHLFWQLNGALFVDAGNIWTIREYEEQPGGAFRFDSFYKQIAVSYGLGFRFDFDYFVLRLDGGMKAINPIYESGKDRYPLIKPKFSRDFAFHFAVGYPF